MLARVLLTPDVRFEGWTTEEWVRFVRLWRRSPASEPGPLDARGGVVVVHHDGRPLKVLHTRRGRIDPQAALPASDSRDAQAALQTGQTWVLAELARAHDARWALGLRLGALDEVMQRFGARARRGDDLTAQSLQLMAIAREMMTEGAIASWPRRLRSVPLPSARVVERALDALCPDGRAMALGLFDDAGLWTSFVARRRGAGFDVIAGPDELRSDLGLLSGDWRRDYRHFARAVEDRYAPLGFGCFAEASRLRALQADATPGAWTRAVALRELIVSPMPAAVGVGLGVDGVRYALRGLRRWTGRVAPFVGGLDPVGMLRALIER